MSHPARATRQPRPALRHTVRAHVGPALESLEGRVLLHGGVVHGVTGVPLAAPEQGVHLRLNTGGKRLIDGTGHVWEKDRYVRGGKGSKKSYDVAGTLDDRLFAQVRQGKFIRYAIPVPAGTYTLNLLFADPKFTGAGHRTFNVTAEGQPALANFDVAASGGGRSAIAQSLPVTIADGTLDIQFQGVVGKAIISGIELFQGTPDPGPTSAWLPAAPAPVALFESQGVAVADKIYLFGGFLNGAVQATPAVNVYDPVTNTWTPRANMPAAVTHGGIVADGTTVWLVGGLLGDYNGGSNLPTKSTWRYDTLTDTWTPGPDLPAASGAGGTAVVGRDLHYFGGFAADGQGDSSKHYALNLDAFAGNPATGWTAAASLPTARNHFGTAVVNGKIYAIGGQHGRDETNRNLRDVNAYDPATNHWTAVAKLPKPMSHFHNATTVVNNKILIAGGVTNGRFPLSDTWEYDPATNAWAASIPLPAPRKAPVAVTAAARLYVLTGSPGDNFPQSDVWYRGIG